MFLFFPNIHVHLWLYLYANQTINLDLIFKCDIIGFYLYSIKNIGLNMPYYFDSFEGMIIEYPISTI
jgi:hypothetical protein